MSNNRGYNIRGIVKEVKRKGKERRRIMNLINKLCINDLKDDNVSVDLSNRDLQNED